ncbi:MAG: hypothetical protein WBG92_12080 [Thiohalocapsa sp.]
MPHERLAMAPDAVDEMESLMRQFGIDGEVRRTIAREVRALHQGQVYIRAADRLGTDEVIREGITNREPPTQIAKRAGGSARTIRRRRSTWL